MAQADISFSSSSSPGKAEGRTRVWSLRPVISRMRFAYPGYAGSVYTGEFAGRCCLSSPGKAECRTRGRSR